MNIIKPQRHDHNRKTISKNISDKLCINNNNSSNNQNYTAMKEWIIVRFECKEYSYVITSIPAKEQSNAIHYLNGEGFSEITEIDINV